MDAAVEFIKVASFSKANNVAFSGFVVFPSLVLMQQQFLSVVKAWVSEMSHCIHGNNCTQHDVM